MAVSVWLVESLVAFALRAMRDGRMTPRTWTCRGCRTVSPKTKRKCPTCGRKRPVRKTAAQRALADEYALWVERFGEQCGICGRKPSAKRRLDRDHCHRSLTPRGLLCARCNRALPSWVTPQWLRLAAYYLERSAEKTPSRKAT